MPEKEIQDLNLSDNEGPSASKLKRSPPSAKGKKDEKLKSALRKDKSSVLSAMTFFSTTPEHAQQLMSDPGGGASSTTPRTSEPKGTRNQNTKKREGSSSGKRSGKK